MGRLTRIKAELKEVVRTRTLQRRNRLRGETPTVAMIGYTNAGKSTLFNCLTGADVLSKDMLFATLDPTMRELDLPSGRKAVLADTVGFISQLPTELVEAFKSTLEEIIHADILLHVHDASSPLVAEEAVDVGKVLFDLGIDTEARATSVIHLFNKFDLLEIDSGQIDILRNLFPGGIFVSAIRGHGLTEVLERLDQHLCQGEISVVIVFTPLDGAVRAWVHENAVVIHSCFDNQGLERVVVSIESSNFARLCTRWPQVQISMDQQIKSSYKLD
jgi:GTP-binding protein HflX